MPIIRAPKVESGFCYLWDADVEEPVDTYLLRGMLYMLQKYGFTDISNQYSHGYCEGKKFRVQGIALGHMGVADEEKSISFETNLYVLEEENKHMRVAAYFTTDFREKNCGFFKTLKKQFIDKLQCTHKWYACHKGYSDWRCTRWLGTRYLNQPLKKYYFEDVDKFLTELEHYILRMDIVKRSINRGDKPSKWYTRPRLHSIVKDGYCSNIEETMPDDFTYLH